MTATDFQEVLTCQSLWRILLLLWQLEVHEMVALGVSCLESYSARLLQYGEIVAHSVKRKPSLVHAKVHVLTDELLVKFPESHIVRTVAFLDEQSQCQASVMIVG